MADLITNASVWKDYDWGKGGEEWSSGFGDSRMEWEHFIWPRLVRHLPLTTAIEIACGRGRWTEFLARKFARVLALDIVPENVSATKARFAHLPHVEAQVCDGVSIPYAALKADLIFSFDSLVHIDSHVMRGYLESIAAKLTQRGVALIHHSNMGAFPGHAVSHFRDPQVSAGWVRGEAQAIGLVVRSQELFDWWSLDGVMSDCLTVFALNGQHGPTVNNSGFLQHATALKAAWLKQFGVCVCGHSERAHLNEDACSECACDNYRPKPEAQ